MTTGAFRIFRLFGIDVSIHWLWFIAAAIVFDQERGHYQSPAWMVAEYLTLFGIVLLHEFGHALACRSVGGSADDIVLWPLGGVAFVKPPPRPGPVLWSIAAGPLVNVALVPVTLAFQMIVTASGLGTSFPDLEHYADRVLAINLILLAFNAQPIYPLDGGQVLQALLWFVIGRARSLAVASLIGVVGAMGVGLAAVVLQSIWLGLIAIFMASQALTGFQQSRALNSLERAPRHRGLGCPSCGAAPLRGPYWSCDQCGTAFDTFDQHAVCPNCFARFRTTKCPECHEVHAIDSWIPTVEAVEPMDVYPA